ncbi:MAG: FAD-dependent oxidoreductase, partial [Myxococcota bacterium]
MSDQRPAIAVVGAGIAGLTAARAIARASRWQVEVYERGERPGGVLTTSAAAGYLREHAANGFLTSPLRTLQAAGAQLPGDAIELAEQLGVATAEADSRAKQRWIFRAGRLHPVPLGPGLFLKSRLLSWRGKLAVLGEPFRR